MEEYLRDAPPSARSDTAGGFMHGPAYAKVHMRFVRASEDLPLGGATDLTKYKTSIFGNRNAYPYVKRLAKGDPSWIDIPSGWRCVRQPNNGGASRPPKSGSCRSGADPHMEQLSYHARYSTNRDLAAGYASDKYPWLTAVYRFRIIKHTPMIRWTATAAGSCFRPTPRPANT